MLTGNKKKDLKFYEQRATMQKARGYILDSVMGGTDSAGACGCVDR